MPDLEASELLARYAAFEVPPLSYATAEDYCDSLDTMEALANVSQGGLKDATRPWMVKAVLGTTRPGARLLEFGAGQPVVADLLQRLGYDVTIVDPYDGRSGGRGATHNGVRSRFPDLAVIRDVFRLGTPGLKPASFDVIYSISVLEHLDVELAGIVDAVRHYLAPEGHTIHTVDYALQGRSPNKSTLSQTRTREICARFGLDDNLLTEAHAAMLADVETFIEPVYSHHRRYQRRPGTYANHPFKRWTSVYLNAAAATVAGARLSGSDGAQGASDQSH